MTRHRWLEAKWPIKIDDFAERLRSHRFTDERGDGFVLERVRADYLEAKYIERLDYLESVEDPFGKEYSFNRVLFNQCSFRASWGNPGLELIDATRKTQGLITRLGEINNYSVAIKPITVNVLDWASNIQEVAQTRWVIDLLQIGELELEKGISAKAIIKGDHDVRHIIQQWTEGKSYNIEKVQIRFKDTYEGTLLLSDSGSAKVEVIQSDDLLRILREALVQMQAQKSSPS